MRMLFKTHLNYLNLLFFNFLLSPLNGRKSVQYLNLDNNMLFDEAEDNKKFTDLISDSLPALGAPENEYMKCKIDTLFNPIP